MQRLQRIISHLNNGASNGSIDLSKSEVSNQSMDRNIPSTMRALYKSQPVKGFSLLHNYPVPTPKEDELLVKSMAVSICGSDGKLYNWYNITDKVAKLPFIPGHEAAGEIVKVGSNINTLQFKIGDRVAIENHFFCDKSSCIQCQNGRGDICPNMGQFGFGKGTLFGGCCEYFIVKSKYCYKLTTPYISWRDAALLEPVGVACNACDRLGIEFKNANSYSNELYLVTGCGPVGLMIISCLKSFGIHNIFAFDILDWKLNIAKKMGAKYVLNTGNMDKNEIIKYVMDRTNNNGFGRIVEASGNEKVISLLFSIIRKGGNIVLVGLPKKKIEIEDGMNNWVLNSIQIRSIHGRRIFESWSKAEKLIQTKQMDLDNVVSHFIPMTQFQKGYDDWFNGKACKVVFDPTK